MSAEVERLQRLLNKVGGLLETDGLMGPKTRRAIADARALAHLPPGETADPALLDWLERQPEPSPDLPTEGVTFIAREETGGRQFYERHAAHPHWPGESSGVTIGVGYDLRFSAEIFERDWSDRLPESALDRLRPFLGQAASADDVAALSDIQVPWPQAWQVFIDRSLPREVGKTRDVYIAFDDLPGLCRSVLVSLVFNRGPSVADSDRRREMREIRDLTVAGDLDAVPERIRAMKRLWPDRRGLRDRRDREADLWEAALRSPGAAAGAVA